MAKQAFNAAPRSEASGPSNPSPRAPRSVPRWVLPALLVLAVAVRLFAWHNATQFGNDAVDYLWQAERWLDGDARSALRHPYHPLTGAAIAAVTLVIGDLVWSGLAVSIGAALLAVLAAHSLARRAFPQQPWAAPGAALLAGVHWRTLMTTSDIASDGPYLGLWLASIACTFAAAERGGCRRRLLLGGLLAGLAYLARPEGLSAAAAPLVWVAAGLLGERAGRERVLEVLRRGLHAAVFGAALLLCVAPYVLLIHELTGNWALSMKPSVGAMDGSAAHRLGAPADAPIASPIVRRRADSASGLTAVTQPPDATGDLAAPAKPVGEVAGEVLGPEPAKESGASTEGSTAESLATGASEESPDTEVSGAASNGVEASVVEPSDLEAGDVEASGDAVAEGNSWWFSLEQSLRRLHRTVRLDTWIFVVPGLWLLWRARPRLLLALAALILMWVAIGTLQFHHSGYLSSRHMLAPALLLVPAGGAGLAFLWGSAANRQGSLRRGLQRWLLRSLVVFTLLVQVGTGARARHSDHAPRLLALEYARQHTAADERLAVYRRKDGFYAQRPVLVLEDPLDEPAALHAMRHYGVRWLILDERQVQRDTPHWLLDPHFREEARFGDAGDSVLVLQFRP
ncbi:MAG: glycosyltransferase family 39 protein [Planctomycetota bacterium]